MTHQSIKSLLPLKSRRHDRKMLADIALAAASGKRKLVRQLVRKYLQSHDAKMVATIRAYTALPYAARPDELNVDELAGTLCAWTGTSELVQLFYKRKGHLSSEKPRLILNFGLKNRALQYLVKAALSAAANLHPEQYCTLGVQRAISRVTGLMAAGYVRSIEIDIKNCFPSFKEEKLHELLPLPKEVINELHPVLLTPA